MRLLNDLIRIGFTFCFICSLIFLFRIESLLAEEINWVEVANINNQVQFIDVNSIKYNNKGLLSVMTKYSEKDLDHSLTNPSFYLMAIDCENRLFSKLTEKSDLNDLKNWTNPINNILIKKTIINACSY